MIVLNQDKTTNTTKKSIGYIFVFLLKMMSLRNWLLLDKQKKYQK